MELLTPRMRLREFRDDDWRAVLAYQRDPRYLRYYAWTDRTEDEVRAFVQMFIDYQHETPRTRFQLATTLRETGQLIGNVGIRRPSADSTDAEIGYELSPEHWGRGYATEAARAVVRFGFTTLGLQRITAWTVAENVGSTRVLEKVGLRPEERLSEHDFYKGRHWDVLVYALSVDEWQRLPPDAGTY